VLLARLKLGRGVISFGARSRRQIGIFRRNAPARAIRPILSAAHAKWRRLSHSYVDSLDDNRRLGPGDALALP
jgi:hypothetical protein